MPPHCDSLDGPVVIAAREALEREDVDLVLPYAPADDEEEIRNAFELAMKARVQGPEANEVADRFFFETVVRIHRAGEGAPFTGVKPAGLDVGPVIPLAEDAIASGSGDALTGFLSNVLHEEVEHRLARVLELKARAAAGLPEAREYTSAMLGLQVWSHKLYVAMKASPHEGGHEHA